ncbi:MAG: MMPL family transporter, partial [Desulfobacteraceae bacterium]|nr:MMPL family transporter [Desulfobacteraceae bacterium]
MFLSLGIKNVVIDESLTNYFHADDPVKQAYDQFRATFKGDEYVYVVYQAKDNDIFSDQSLKALKKLHNDLTNYRLKYTGNTEHPLDHIDEVKSLINVQYMEARNDTLFSRNFIGDRLPRNLQERESFRQKALNHPDYPLIYLSENCQYGGIVIRTDFNAQTAGLSRETKAIGSQTSSFDDEDQLFADDAKSMEIVSAEDAAAEIIEVDIREYPPFMKEIRSILSKKEYTDALKFYPVGNPVLMDFFTVAVIGDMERLMSIVLLLVIILLWVLFRSLSAVLWPVIIVALTIIWVLGFVGWSNIAMSAMLQIIIFLSLSVGIADSVHILSGYLFFRNQNYDHKTALNAVMKKSGLACLLTSLTTAVGLLSLTLVPLKPIATFGLFSALAVLLAFVFTIILLPLMLDLWSPVSKKKTKDKDHLVLSSIKKIENVGFNNAGLIIFIFAAASIILFYGLLQLKVDSNFVEIIKKGMPLRAAYNLVDDHMGGTGNMEV